MVIVCTQDFDVIRYTHSHDSKAQQWGSVLYLTPCLSQAKANAELKAFITQLQENEPLCLSAHGNDNLIGDADDKGWTWSYTQIAALLKGSAPANYTGPILIRACALHVSNFSAGLAVALQKISALNKVWIYGYNKALAVDTVYPAPAKMASQADLQGTQVVY